MSKNRPTLKTQFLNFISRLAPFDGNPLIQKTEHDQVVQDHLDSSVLKNDEPVNVATAGTMNLDASTADLFIIDTGAAGTAARTININNLETGQRVRVEITKKVGDTFTVPSSEWWPITLSDGSIVQTGLTDLSFEAWNINGTTRLSLLEPIKGGVSADDAIELKIKVISIGDWDMDATVFLTIAHGLDATKIRNLSVMILDDTGEGTSLLTSVDFLSPGVTLLTGAYLFSGTNIVLSRTTGGWFDSTKYNLTPFNRGFITIIYQA